MNFSKEIYSKNDSTSKRLELRELSSRKSFSIVQKTDCIATNGVKPLYSGHPQFLKKVPSIRRYPLYRILDFFKVKIIIDKNLTIFYVNCGSLQLHSLKKI